MGEKVEKEKIIGLLSPLFRIDVNWSCSKESELMPRASGPRFDCLWIAMKLSNGWSDWEWRVPHMDGNSCCKHLGWKFYNLKWWQTNWLVNVWFLKLRRQIRRVAEFIILYINKVEEKVFAWG